jgi:carbamoyl-phosphate synthase small subunit
MLVDLDKPAVLLLEDGTVFHGYAIGKIGTTTGEVCFNTGMTGYQEIFTDPSYFRQIMVMTSVHIGNYGTHTDEDESDTIKIAGLVVKNFNRFYSRQVASHDLQEYLESKGLVGISAIDTRSLVRHIREKGAMNAIISSEILDVTTLQSKLKKIPGMEGLELASEVSTSEPYFLGDSKSRYKISILDYGVKRSILKFLAERGCYLKVFPAKSTFQEVNEWGPDGYFLSNGPGDPAAMNYAVELAKQLIDSGKPVFGICLGHQLIARAVGMDTFKMHYGHRGINHPVHNIITGKSEITSQNHGFCVEEPGDKFTESVEITHKNLNDGSLEGLALKGKNVFSVQYHPEASPGPHDSRYLFDQFIELLRKN